KEGFLRSERSLIQTIGRAARNLNGKAILYADRVTGSMERAIAESEKRRNTQLAYNAEHNITPQGVSKRVADIMEGAYGGAGESRSRRKRAVAEKNSDYAVAVTGMDAKALAKEISRQENRMYEAARNLDFEEAAAVRDRIAELKRQLMQA